jgi:hypothetical protein
MPGGISRSSPKLSRRGIYGPVRYARAFFVGRSRIETRTYIRPLTSEEGYSSRAIMESALLLLISSAASKARPFSGFEEAGLTGYAIVGGSSISLGINQLLQSSSDLMLPDGKPVHAQSTTRRYGRFCWPTLRKPSLFPAVVACPRSRRSACRPYSWLEG